MFLSTCQPETCAFYGRSLATLFPVLGPSQCVRLPCRSATRARVTAWVPTHAPTLWVIRPGSSLPSSRAMHANHLLGRDPLMGRLCPSGFPTVVRIVASLHLMHGSLVSWVSSFWYWGCGLKTKFFYLLLLSGVPRPKASMPLLCRLLHGYPYPWVSGGDTSLTCQASQAPLLCWAWTTPEAGQRPRPWTLKKLLTALLYFLVDPSLGVPLCWLWSTSKYRMTHFLYQLSLIHIWRLPTNREV